MKISKKSIKSQRSIIEKKIRPWVQLKYEKVPPSGWIRAIRKALGMSSRQLANLIGVSQPTVYQLEDREVRKKVTLDSLEKAALAMNCKLIYAFVPKGEHQSLDDILNERATRVAQRIVGKTEHSMKLESQGRSEEQIKENISELAAKLKTELDSKLWDDE